MTHEHINGEICENCKATFELAKEILAILPDNADITLAALAGALAVFIDNDTEEKRTFKTVEKLLQTVNSYALSVLKGRGWKIK